ncbi:MAG: cytochrome P450 [Devosiaceae bacterium]|nr:cytochrome P450 [Devosiaceae bacterium]
MNNSAPFQIDQIKKSLSCDPQDNAFVQNPYALYEAMYGGDDPLMWQQYGHWVFASWHNVNALLRDKRFGRQILHLTSREQLGWPELPPHTADFVLSEKHSLLNVEPPVHTRLRTLVNRAFVSRQVEQLRPQVEQLAHKLIDDFESDGKTDLLKSFATPIPLLIITQMLAIPEKDGPMLLDWSHKIVAMYMFGRTLDDELTANQAAKEFSAYLQDLINQRRKNIGEDLLSHMISTEAKGEHLSDEELISSTILLLNAGHEATVHQTGNAVKTILESPHAAKTLFTNDAQTATTVEECIRFDAPLHMFTRYALEDLELDNGIKLKMGDEVGLLLAAANHDPSQFKNANTFDPFRKIAANATFGAGIHFCIGAPLARLEMQTSLKVLFERLPNLKLAEPPEYMNAYHFHGLEKLIVSW